MKNNFFSAELSKKYSADLEQFVRYQADEYINEELRAKQQEIDKLITAIELLREFNTFPNESFESMRRVVELLADIVVEPSNSRHQFEVILDRILVEISSMKIIQQHIRQGSIMLLNERSELKIIGQYNMPNSVVRNKKVLLGEKFAGKVAQSGEVVWIESVNTPGAEIEYGFESNNNRPYDGIMGFPIRESGIENYRPVGVIILHFAKGFQPEQDQMTAVSKVLEVYAQLIISSIKIQNYQMKLRNKYGIIGVEEEVSTTFYSGGDTE
ncbi:hypothetical protein YDYSY3_38380 [Paenibacillus chitinolyticus]|nr:hypothetical protein YDYSY3_38380 [Paenibacillus chitinolyticus]